MKEGGNRLSFSLSYDSEGLEFFFEIRNTILREGIVEVFFDVLRGREVVS